MLAYDSSQVLVYIVIVSKGQSLLIVEESAVIFGLVFAAFLRTSVVSEHRTTDLPDR